MKTFIDSGNPNSPQDPLRWTDMAHEAVGPAAKLLRSPPPIQALPSEVAMRVRANVLGVPVAPSPLTQAKSALARNAAALKLGGIAVVAALFGAGAVTAVTAVKDAGELRVVASPPPTQKPNAAKTSQRRGEVPQRTAALAPELAHEGHTNDQTPPSRAELGGDGLRSSRDGDLTSELARGSAGHEAGRAAGSRTLVGGGLGANSERSLEAQPPSSSPGAETSRSAIDARRHASSSKAGLELLAASEGIERPVVRPEFRRVATRKAHAQDKLTSLEEETRLLEDARSKLGRDPHAALGLALEHQTRFRKGQLFEQRRMIHLEALLRLGRDDEARKLASSIGSSIYQARANALLVRYGIAAR